VVGASSAFHAETEVISIQPIGSLPAEGPGPEGGSEFFELPLGVLAAAALFKMTLALFAEETTAFLDETLALQQFTPKRGDFDLQFGCGGSVNAKSFSMQISGFHGHLCQDRSGFVRVAFRYQRHGCACFKSMPPSRIASCS
jgi:hypothetical protein